MLTSKLPRNILFVAVAAGLSLAAVAAVLVAKAFRPADDLSHVMRKDGFDFSELRAPGNQWRGPEIGEKIDLRRLRGADGRTLADVTGEGPTMLVAVDPTCAMCRIAADTMKDINSRLSPLNVPYYVIAFVPVGDNFHAYAESLIAGRPSFIWTQDEGVPPDSLLDAVSRRTFSSPVTAPCSASGRAPNKAKPVRDRMGAHLVADANVIVDTLTALSR
jgi:hypothetical protein